MKKISLVFCIFLLGGCEVLKTYQNYQKQQEAQIKKEKEQEEARQKEERLEKICEAAVVDFSSSSGKMFDRYAKAIFVLLENYAKEEGKELSAEQKKEFKSDISRIRSSQEQKEEISSFLSEDNLGCAKYENFEQGFRKPIRDYYYAQEEKILKKRIGNKKLTKTQLLSFVWPKYSNVFEIPEKGKIYRNKTLGRVNYLEVIQVLNDGVLVWGRSYNGSTGDILYIQTDDKYVDNAPLDPGRESFYEYVGTFSYNTVFGKKTVHRFKKIPNPLNGLVFID